MHHSPHANTPLHPEQLTFLESRKLWYSTKETATLKRSICHKERRSRAVKTTGLVVAVAESDDVAYLRRFRPVPWRGSGSSGRRHRSVSPATSRTCTRSSLMDKLRMHACTHTQSVEGVTHRHVDNDTTTRLLKVISEQAASHSSYALHITPPHFPQKFVHYCWGIWTPIQYTVVP